MKIEVKQGQCWVNFIHEVVRGENFVVLQADLRAKYAQLFATSGCEVYIEAGPGTLHAEEGADQPTVVSVEIFPKQTVDALISRYTLTLFVYVTPEDPEKYLMVWP